ncbi:MAG: ribonuclease III [Actinobacteria bacterium]|nr:ribonuclease III [Actinomycetota bacterium]
MAGDPARAEGAERLAERLGHAFTDRELLPLALTHRSWCAENAGFASNERLEFLGDAVLGVVVTDHVFRTYEGMPEGELAKLRAGVVSAATLAEVARNLDLGESLRLGKGEDASGGREKSSILADALEAVLGAVYVDGGFMAVAPIILRLLAEHIVEASAEPGNRDFKTQLQELAAHDFDQLPTYDVRDEGPDHEKRFFATVRLDGVVKGEGEGKSKKQAEQAAARAAWSVLTAELAEQRGLADCPNGSDDGGNDRERERADA